MPINGGTAVKMTLPSGVSLHYDTFIGQPIVLDPNAQVLYVVDQQSTAHVIQLTLSANGQSFTSGVNDFAPFDSNAANDGAEQYSIAFDSLPTLASVSGTSSEVIQGSGSAVTLLTGAPTITDPDGTNQAGATIEVSGGHKGDGTTLATGLAGDEILVAGVQSGTVDGGKVSVAWNSTTHVLTLTGDVPETDYQTLLGEISFKEDASADATTGSHPTRTLTFISNDGVTIAHPTTSDPNEKTTSITLDRAPTLVADAPASQALESGSAVTATAGTGVLSNDSDPDGDTVTLSAFKNASNTVGSFGTALAGSYGHLTLNANGSYSYVADTTAAINAAATGSHPTDVFTYTDSDGFTTASSTLTFTIDRAPTVAADSASLLRGATTTGGGANVLSNDSDKDGDTLTVSAVAGSVGNVGASTAGTYGHLTLNAGGTYSYVADNTAAIDAAATGAHPIDTFAYTASDGHGGTTNSSIAFTVDRAPTTASDSAGALRGATVTATALTGVLHNDSDPDGDTLTVTAIKNAANTSGTVGASLAGTYGHLTLNADGSYSYIANTTAAIDAAATGSHPTDVFTYTASDGQGGTATATLTFSIDRAPVAVADTATVLAAATASGTAGAAGTGVLHNDSDADGDTLTLSGLSGGTLGTALAGTYGHLTLNADGSYSYAADNASAIGAQPDNAVLTDAFTYTASDGHGGTANATLTFTVDQAPTVTSFNAAATSGANLSASHTVTFTLAVGKNVTVPGGTELSLSDGGTATYVSGSGSQTLTFSYSSTHAPGALSVTGVAAGSLADAAGNPLAIAGTAVGSYTDAVSDTAAHVSAQFDSLNAAVSSISAIALTDGGTPNLDLTATQALNDQTLIGKISSPFDLVVLDSAANVQTAIDSLQGDQAAIHAVDLTGGGTPTLTITQTQDSNDAAILAKIAGPFDLLVTGASGTAPNVDSSATPPQYSSFEQFYDGTHTLIQTIYFNVDGTHTTVSAGGSQTVDDSSSTSNDFFDLSNSTSADVTGGSGNDTINFGAAFNPATDQIDGGAGTNNQVGLDGSYGPITLAANTIANIQVIALLGAHSYDLTTVDANVASGQQLTIWALNADSLAFNGSAETDGSFRIFATAGADTLTGGAGADIFYGLGGADTITGGGGGDLFIYTQPSDSTGNAHDTVTDFDAALDRFQFPVSVAAVDPTIVGGTLDSGGSFDSELATAVNAGNLAAHDAVLFEPNAGSLSGHILLVVDANATAGYQAGQDYVIDITNASNLASLSTSDFI
jgi:VCBS repeat-containing protein